MCRAVRSRTTRSRARSRPARSLKVSTDVLLGVKPVRDTLAPKTARRLQRLQRIEELPPADQRAVLKLVDAMLDTRRRVTPPRTTRKAS